MYYITLTGGKTVEDALNDMFNNNPNTTSSNIKGNSTTSGTLDYWYYNNMEQKGYSSYVEDTVWCNDRSIYQLNGWDPDGSIYGISFGGSKISSGKETINLICSRSLDKFTVNTFNGNGKLDYPVGLLTIDETILAGGHYINPEGAVLPPSDEELFYLYTGSTWWTMSPVGQNNYGSTKIFTVSSNGDISNNTPNSNLGIRPSISLKSGTEIIDGNGIVNSPYIVKTN